MDHDREPVLENHAALVPGALDSLTSEERYHLYKVLKLKVLVAKNADLKIEMAGTPMDGWVGYKCVHSGRHAYPGPHRLNRPDPALYRDSRWPAPPHGRVTGYRRRWYTSALMLRRAPERTVDERRNALEEANRVRFARAAAKRNLKSGELDIYDLLMDPSEELRGAKVEEMLFAMKGMGRIKVTRVLREVGISRSKTLVGLTHGQRDRLIGALGCEDG
jgi:hypothetical protein